MQQRQVQSLCANRSYFGLFNFTGIEMKKIIVSASLLFAAVSSSQAMSIKQYQDYMRNPKTRETVTMLVGATGFGAMWSNIVLESRGKNRLYCPPADKQFVDTDFVSILDAAIPSASGDYAMVEMVLVNALADKYPCKK